VLVSHVQNYVQRLIRPPVRHWRLTTAVVNRVRPSKPVVNTHRPLCCQHLLYDTNVEREAGQLFIAVAIFLLLLSFVVVVVVSSLLLLFCVVVVVVEETAGQLLWLPVSLRQSTNQSPSHSPHLIHGSSCTSPSFLPSLTPSLFHSRLKTYLFYKSFPP